jgi:hypothetical protein
MKNKWHIKFGLPRLYGGEKWFKFSPLEISLEQDGLKIIESTLNICGFFAWHLYIFHDKDIGSGFNLSILGFRLDIDYDW